MGGTRAPLIAVDADGDLVYERAVQREAQALGPAVASRIGRLQRQLGRVWHRGEGALAKGENSGGGGAVGTARAYYVSSFPPTNASVERDAPGGVVFGPIGA